MSTYLSDHAPVIVDATCLFYRNWPPFECIRMDNRTVVSPDLVGDARFMPFRNESLDEVYLDPPHMIRKDPMIMGHDISQIKRRLSGRLSEGDLTRYGFFRTRDDWIDFLDRVNSELLRVLKPQGKAVWKLTFGTDRRYIKREDIDRVDNFVITEERITPSKKPGSKNKVHWVTMKRKGERLA